MVSRRAQGNNTQTTLASSQTPTQPLAPFPSSTGQERKPKGKAHVLTEGQGGSSPVTITGEADLVWGKLIQLIAD